MVGHPRLGQPQAARADGYIIPFAAAAVNSEGGFFMRQSLESLPISQKTFFRRLQNYIDDHPPPDTIYPKLYHANRARVFHDGKIIIALDKLPLILLGQNPGIWFEISPVRNFNTPDWDEIDVTGECEPEFDGYFADLISEIENWTRVVQSNNISNQEKYAIDPSFIVSAKDVMKAALAQIVGQVAQNNNTPERPPAPPQDASWQAHFDWMHECQGLGFNVDLNDVARNKDRAYQTTVNNHQTCWCHNKKEIIGI